MNLHLVSNIIISGLALIGFVYGIVKYLKPDKPVFAKMVTLADGCMVFGGLYLIIRILIGVKTTQEFQLGILAFIGSMMFLFSANYGAIDELADNRSKAFMKYRIIALAAPLSVAALVVIFLFCADVPVFDKVIGGVTAVFSMQITYYNLKHLIIPAAGDSVLKALKPYNVLALCFSACSVAQNIAISRNRDVATLIISVFVGVTLLLLPLSVEKGVKKWTT